MEDFLLLGQVPGTQIIITFEMWLLAFTALFICMSAWLLLMYRRQLRQIASKAIARAKLHELNELDHIAL